ncbi:TPA_asm: RNA-directed RNA polymerase [ssRNA phage Gerhypos.1_40]|uniref:RNA-directed RNA polymerase n=2 Tax=Leviviricetes TaxID=2842243 RepID=A0A8S5L3X9_9VIRU|nr:RNA-directed RNA polymerase [ssRNA phage Gerhypos.1_40]QDH89710.1 MAG: RNA-dependent RNA polymerase [Leviviridae sp.]DAD52124.1 TPA_asm: RNA-directed RNA polymerase [ssRNA phage Gerhypos.1_40]
MSDVVMKIQTIYDRLHRDVCSKYGENPPLQVSRAPVYEALWKKLLATIEEMGAEKVSSVLIIDAKASLISSGPADNTVDLLVGLESGALLSLIQVPQELLALVRTFLAGGLKPSVLQDIRQICLFTYKIKSHEVTKTQRDSAIEGFRSRNAACCSITPSSLRLKAQGKGLIPDMLRIARLLSNVIVANIDWREVKPSHGPGAVSDAKRSGSSKWRAIDGKVCRVTDKFYPMAEFFTPSPSWFNHQEATFVDPICKLAIVPKDRRGPRVICTQPSGLMWIQQGQRRVLERTIETSRILSTNRGLASEGIAGSIKFDRHENNGWLALESSRTREFATVDLKDASDLVSWGLVQFLFTKGTNQFLAASRATHVKIDGVQEKLHMYAPMGSAMCFPIESLVFWVIAAAATYVSRGVTYEEIVKSGSATKWVENNKTEVFVFGDDILVRREACTDVCECLKAVGLVPNMSKTFVEGFFREACGVDAFHGEQLVIARLQNIALTSMSDAYAIIDASKRLRRLGMIHTAQYLEEQTEAFLGFRLAAGVFPGGPFWERDWTCDAEGARKALSWNLRRNTEIRFNTDYQYFEAKTVIASPLPTKEPQDGRCRLFRGLTTGVDEHTVDWLNPDNTQYHLGWVRAF